MKVAAYQAVDMFMTRSQIRIARFFTDQASVEARLRYMDEHGIDIQAVSLEPGYNYAYWEEQDLASRIVERQNKHLLPRPFESLCGG